MDIYTGVSCKTILPAWKGVKPEIINEVFIFIDSLL